MTIIRFSVKFSIHYIVVYTLVFGQYIIITDTISSLLNGIYFYTSDHTFASGNTVAIPNITVGKNIVHINHTDNYVFATADEGNHIYAYNTDYSKWYTIHPSDFTIRESIIIGDYVYCVADGISIIRLSVTDPNDNKVFSLAEADPLQQCWDLIYCEPYFVLTGHESGKLFVVKLNDNDLSLVDEMVLSKGQVLNIIRFNDMFLITTDEKYIHIFQKSNKLSISDNNIVVNNSLRSDHIETQSINAPPYNDRSVLHVNNFVALEITANEQIDNDTADLIRVIGRNIDNNCIRLLLSDNTELYNAAVFGHFTFDMSSDEKIKSTSSAYMKIKDGSARINVFRDHTEITKNLIVNGTIKQKSSQTITHCTGMGVDGNLEVGAFCESDGTVFDYPDGIKSTDCICNIRKATELNSKVMGVVTNLDPPTFATHGDVLMKLSDDVNIDDLNVGDVLVCGENGYAKIGTKDEVLECMLMKIPTAKVTSKEYFENRMIPCFL